MDIPQKIVSSTDLQNAIQHLEEKHKLAGKELKHQFEIAFESVKPINLVKSTLSEIASSKEIKGDILNASIGLAAGVLSKFLFVGSSGNPLRKLAGTMLMFGVTNVVSKHTSPVRLLGRKLLKLIKQKKDPLDDRQLLE